jgi:predicted MFS family arabinose efflux permease
MTIYWLSGSLASLIGFILGGLLNEHYGWRMTFFIIGTPGLLAAVVVKLTVRDPRSRAMPGPERVPRPPSLVEVLSTLWRQRSARHLGLAIISLWMMAAGLAPWYAAFMMRSHGMGTAELGLWLGLICGCGATAGTLLGGYIVGRFFPGNEPAQMRFSAVSIVSVVPCFVLFLLLPHKRQALMALAPLMIVFNIFLGPTFALLQRLVVAEMRATTLAVVMLLSNLIGMGVGPQIVGLLSDALTPTFGTDSLRVAMLIVSFVAMWSAWHFWQVGKTVKDDLQSLAARANSSAQPSGLHEVVLQP